MAGRARVGRGKQTVVIPVDRCLHGISELAPGLATVSFVLVGIAQSYAELASQLLDRPLEIEVLHVSDERDDIALGLAAEAVKDALLRID